MKSEIFAEMWRSVCTDEIAPGVHAMNVDDRSAFKDLAVGLGLWGGIKHDLMRTRCLTSPGEKAIGAASAAVYQSPQARPPLFAVAYIALSTYYEREVLTDFKAVLVIAETVEREEVAYEVAKGICNIFEQAITDIHGPVKVKIRETDNVRHRNPAQDS